MSELLLIKGITPSLLFGERNETSSTLGLVDLFTPVSSRFININTASSEVLQTIPDVDGNLANAIIETRNGPDQIEGNEDDMPFRSIGEIQNVPGMTSGIAALFGRYFGTRSSVFEVTIDVSLERNTRRYVAWLTPERIFKFVEAE